FGFVNPSSVVHGVHLVPVFSFLLNSSWSLPLYGNRLKQMDWVYFYVDMYVYKSSQPPTNIRLFSYIFMHFRSGGIGHKATHDWDEFLQ
ncbi:hypothetical protein OG21DRAFT_1413329, partial [Imleria badia]